MMQISETYTEKYEQDSLIYLIGNADTCIYDAYQGIYKQLQQKDEDATVIHCEFFEFQSRITKCL